VRPSAVAFAAIACIAPTFDCAATAPPHSAQIAVDAEPRWEDVIDTTPELLAVVFPTALRKDRVYGPLLRRAIDLVRSQSRVVTETRALDAMEDAEEVIVGVRPDPGGVLRPGGLAGESAGEVVVVVRGVRADVDPVSLVDAEGQPLWVLGPSGRVRELVRSDARSVAAGSPAASPVPASLFELPGRTWLIASGDARARARDAFARSAPTPRRAPRFELFEPNGVDTLAVLRIDGPSLVARVRALRPSGALGALGRRLEAVTFELAAGSTAPDGRSGADPTSLRRTIRASLSYADGDAAASAEETARDVVGAIARKKPDDLAWLASATVDRPGAGAAPGLSVVVSAPLPPQLVGALLHAGAATLDTAPPTP
jgi:hypothetical protein